MPIPVTCPGCQARLNVPDAAAGKKVKCPTCRGLIRVPGTSATGSGSAPVLAALPPQPRPEPLPLDLDDALPLPPRKSGPVPRPAARPRPRPEPLPLDDDDDTPRRAGKGGPPAGVVIGLAAVLSLAVIGGIGYGAYHLFFKGTAKDTDKDGGTASRAKVPDGWAEFKTADFTAYFPKKPAEEKIPAQAVPLPGVKEGVEYLAKDKDVEYEVLVLKFQKAPPDDQRKALAEQLISAMAGSRPGAKPVQKEMTWLGKPAVEVTVEPSGVEGKGGKDGPKGTLVGRIVLADGKLFVVSVDPKTGSTPAELKNGFFDNFTLPAAASSTTGSGSGTTGGGSGSTTASSGGKGKAPPGWVEFKPSGGGFRVFFPGPPEKSGDIPGGGGKMYMARDGVTGYTVMAMKLPPGIPPDQRGKVAEAIAGSMAAKGKPPERKPSTLAGQSATELTIDQGAVKSVARVLVTADSVFMAMVTFPASGGRPKPEVENGFFASFELVK
jgi:hypothetical protein